jgi:hypothetical protein
MPDIGGDVGGCGGGAELLPRRHEGAPWKITNRNTQITNNIQIPSTQIPTKSQISIFKITVGRGGLELGIWGLDIICDLLFVYCDFSMGGGMNSARFGCRFSPPSHQDPKRHEGCSW